MNARTLPASSRLCSCWTTSSMCSLDIPGNFTASRSTTSASARNSSLTPIGKVSALQATPVKASQFAFRASRNGQQNDGGRLAAHVHPSKVLTGGGTFQGCQCGCSLLVRGGRFRPCGRAPAATGRYSIRRFSVLRSRRSCRRAFLSGRSMADKMVSVTVIQRNAVPNTKAISSSVLIPQC